MKTTAVVALLVSSAAGFVPASNNGREVSVAQNALANKIFGLDLFDPQGNTFGARSKKNLKQGKLTEKSYVPSGLTKAQYEEIRKKEQLAREKKYQEKAKNAFKFTDFTEWYLKRGTSLDFSWRKDVNLGHTMAKTKFDWSGKDPAKPFAAVVKDNNKKK